MLRAVRRLPCLCSRASYSRAVAVAYSPAPPPSAVESFTSGSRQRADTHGLFSTTAVIPTNPDAWEARIGASQVCGGIRGIGTTSGWRQTSSWQQGGSEGKTKKQEKSRWQFLSKVEKRINPCNSPLHPAAKLAGIQPEAEKEKCVQEAYNPNSECYGCGTKSVEGLHLKSYRSDNGLQAIITFDKKHQAFPGIINGGVIATVMDCHANWTAAVALMDRSCTARPPLTLSHHLQVTFNSPIPVGKPLVMISQVKRIDEADGTSNMRTSVKVEVKMYLESELDGNALAEGMGIFKKMGAVREM